MKIFFSIGIDSGINIFKEFNDLKGADYVIKDDTELPYDNITPLWLLGFGY